MLYHVNGEEDLSHLYEPFLQYIENMNHHSTSMPTPGLGMAPEDSTAVLKEQVSQTGSIISTKWSAGEVKGSGWNPGWYRAEVQGYSEDDDTITV